MGSTFIPSRCAAVDRVGSNVLIRGNMPLVGPDLRYALKEIREASRVEDLASRTIVEIPIIDNVGERAQFEPLLRAFGVDPSIFPPTDWPWWLHGVDGNERRGTRLRTEGLEVPGFLVWRPFEGLPEKADPTSYLTAPGWDFAGFVDHVIALLSELEDAAVYVHCQLGADRTGAFHTGYLMRAHGADLEEAARAADSSTSAGPPNADYQRLLGAYSAFIG